MAKKEKEELAVVDPTPTGLAIIPGQENIDMEDISLQTLYPDGKAGYFRDSLDEKSKKETLTGVLLTFNKGYKLREGDPPKTTCRSFFGDHGTVGVACDGCPRRMPNRPLTQEEYSQMTTEEVAKYVAGIKDYCKRVYDWLFIPDGQDMPAIISIASTTSLGNVKKFITIMAKQRQKPFYAAKVKLSMEAAKSAKGFSYYLINFEILGDTSAEQQAKYAKIMELYRQRPAADEDEPANDFSFTEKL